MEGFYRGTINDTDILYEFDMVPAERAVNIQRLRHPDIYVFINSTKDCILIYEPSWGNVPWLCVHAYTKAEKGRSKRLKTLFYRTGIWLFEHTGTEVLTGVVGTKLRRYGLLLGTLGATRVATIEGTTIYAVPRSELEEFKERLRDLEGPKLKEQE